VSNNSIGAYAQGGLNDIGAYEFAGGGGGPVAALAGILYPRDAMATDEQRFQDFIDASGITQTGDLARDYREALHSVAGAPNLDINFSIDDIFKIYFDSL
jgi:hypothetical protein